MTYIDLKTLFVIYTRTLGDKKGLVLCHFHDEVIDFTMTEEIAASRFTLLLGNCLVEWETIPQ